MVHLLEQQKKGKRVKSDAEGVLGGCGGRVPLLWFQSSQRDAACSCARGATRSGQGDLSPNLGSIIMSTWSSGEGLHLPGPQFSHL